LRAIILLDCPKGVRTMEFRDIKTWIAKQSPSLEDIPPQEESKLVSFHFADI
jgi:hypothetical protein